MKNSPLNLMPYKLPWMLKDITYARYPEGFSSPSEQMMALVDAVDENPHRKVSDEFLGYFFV